MKKGLVLATIFALCSTMMVSAKEFNGDRWQWFYSNSDYTGKVDLNTLSYDPETDTAKAWAVWIRTTGVQELISYDIYFEDNSIDPGQYHIYQDGSDTAYVQESFHGQNYTAAPGSGDEALIASVKGLVGRDAKLADYEKQQSDEAQARTEEKARLEKAQQEARIAQQKEAERKAKHERNRSIIRGILGI
jgi:hypothetical protein